MTDEAVQGFLAQLTLDGTDITNTVMSTPLSRSRTILNKAVMDGSGDTQSIPGLRSGDLSVSGILSQAEHNSLEVTYAKDVPVPFILTVTEGLTTDASWAGLVTLGDLTVDPVGDGMWEFQLSGDTSGAVTYTPSAP